MGTALLQLKALQHCLAAMPITNESSPHSIDLKRITLSFDSETSAIEVNIDDFVKIANGVTDLRSKGLLSDEEAFATLKILVEENGLLKRLA